jgi:hypothetical protein
MKTQFVKNSFILIAMSKQILWNYILRSPTYNEGHHFVGLLLEVVMDKFITLTSHNCRNFLSRSKGFVYSGMDMIDSIMTLINHLGFKLVHGSKFPR